MKTKERNPLIQLKRENDNETKDNTENNENNGESDTDADEKDENREEAGVEEENDRSDLQNDVIGAKYLQVENSVYYTDYEIFSVEVPKKDHNKPEVKSAKDTEIENLRTYETFEEVKDEGQETIGSR